MPWEVRKLNRWLIGIPKAPPGQVKPRTFDQQVADDLKDIEAAKKNQEEWEAECDRIRKARADYEKAHETEWMERRNKCAASLGILSNEIKIRKNNWENTAINVAKTYEAAFKARWIVEQQKTVRDMHLQLAALSAARKPGGSAKRTRDTHARPMGRLVLRARNQPQQLVRPTPSAQEGGQQTGRSWLRQQLGAPIPTPTC